MGGVCPTCGTLEEGKVFCKHCGGVIDKDCVVCPICGKQVKDLQTGQPSINIVNHNDSVNTNVNTNRTICSPQIGVGPYPGGRLCKKSTALLLCLFLGLVGGHKFYEGKICMGILYILTCGLFGIGYFVDLISLCFKPEYYYV